MSTKLKTRKTDKGGSVRSVTFGNVTVDIYSRAKKVNGYDYTVFEVADFTQGTRRMRSFTKLEKAVAEAERIAKQLSTGNSLAAQMDSREAASYGNAVQILRDAGLETRLEVVAAKHVEAVKILGSDRIAEACARLYPAQPG